VAFGFRIGGRPAAERAAPAQAPAPIIAVPEVASRTQQLAFDLQRDQVQAAARYRPQQLAAALATSGAAAHRALPSDSPARLGDTYRRPAVERARP
jgi:hypothetical protein